MDSLQLFRCADSAMWNEVVQAAAQATPYHLWEWCRAQEQLHDGTAFEPHMFVDGGDRYVVPVFRLKDGLCLSRFGYGSVAGPHPERLRFADLEAALVETLGAPLRRALLAPGTTLADTRPGYDGWINQETQTLDLPPDFSTLWNAAASNARQQVRYGAKHGLTVRDLTADDWPRVAEMENAFLAEKGADIRFPLDFWLAVEAAFASNGLLKMGAYHDDELVGAAIFLQWRTASYYLIGVSGDVGRRVRSGHTLLAAGLERACDAGLSVIDLGPSPEPELARTKRIWGARTQQYLVFEGRSAAKTL